MTKKTPDQLRAEAEALLTQVWGRPDAIPALTLLDFKGSWAVTLNDYRPDTDDVSTIRTFDTKEQAEAFIAERSKQRSATGSCR